MNNSNIHKSGYIILIYFIMTQFVGIIGVQLLAKTGWYDIQGNQQQAIQKTSCSLGTNWFFHLC